MQMKLFNEYEEHYINKSDNTLISYRNSVESYYKFCEEKLGLASEEEVIKATTWSEVTRWRNTLVKDGLSPYSVNVRISGLRSFFKFLVLTHRISSNPVEEVENIGTKAVEQHRDFLTEAEFLHLIDVIKTPSGKKQDRFSFTSKRDAFLVGLFVTSGLRISELLSLKVGQIDTETKSVKVVGKGSKLRTVPVSSAVIKLMQEYLAERATVATDSDSLFVNIKGGKLSPQGTNQNIKKYCERAGIEKHISAHCLRHSAITNMIDKGVPVARVQVIAGHSDSSTTARYYKEHLDTMIDDNFFPEF